MTGTVIAPKSDDRDGRATFFESDDRDGRATVLDSARSCLNFINVAGGRINQTVPKICFRNTNRPAGFYFLIRVAIAESRSLTNNTNLIHQIFHVLSIAESSCRTSSRRRNICLAILLGAGALSGCSGTFLRPEKDRLLDATVAEAIPNQWAAKLASAAALGATGWLDDLNSRELQQLVERALEANQDLRAATARVRSAEARARIQGAARKPSVSADLGASRAKRLRGDNTNSGGQILSGSSPDSAFESFKTESYDLGLSASWEIDLWGRLANQRDAATKEFLASQSDLAAARLSLAANVAKSAIALHESEQQVALTRENLKSLEANLEILDSNLEAGVAGDRLGLDISLARADVARSKASLQADQRTADTARRRLEILLGGYPKGRLAGLSKFPTVSRTLPVGLPSELLLRRPDLIAAELRADAALDEIASSRKALLPSLRLNVGAGTSSSDDLNLLLDERALVWNIAGSLAQQLFQGGRLRATIELAKAEAEEVAARYSGTALQAFSEVESALAAETFYLAQEAQLHIAAQEAQRAADLAVTQYENGLVEILTVLDSQRRAFDARSVLLSVRSQRIQNRIDLYLALGGDFDSNPNK